MPSLDRERWAASQGFKSSEESGEPDTGALTHISGSSFFQADPNVSLTHGSQLTIQLSLKLSTLNDFQLDLQLFFYSATMGDRVSFSGLLVFILVFNCLLKFSVFSLSTCRPPAQLVITNQFCCPCIHYSSGLLNI